MRRVAVLMMFLVGTSSALKLSKESEAAQAQASVSEHIVSKLVKNLEADEELALGIVRATAPTVTERLCEMEDGDGGIDTKASRGDGAAFAWCKKGLPQNSVQARGLLSLSYGVETWDSWSQRLSDTYGVRSVLLDCFVKDGDWEKGGLNVSKWKVPYVAANECLGTESAYDNYGRKFEPLSSRLEDRMPLSVLLKLDVEGAEWGALEKLQPEELDKVALLDVEFHFCRIGEDPPSADGFKSLNKNKRRQRRRARSGETRSRQDTYETWLVTLENLLERFAVVGRSPKAMKEENELGREITELQKEMACDGAPVDMMSVSYVNKRLLIGDPLGHGSASVNQMANEGMLAIGEGDGDDGPPHNSDAISEMMIGPPPE